jgi:phosphoserine aminotransferase
MREAGTMTLRVHNFGPGPAALPLAALQHAQQEFLDFQGSGMSILEHSHRGKAYEAVHEEAISLLSDLLNLPSNYRVLLLQGGARQQFAMVPMNLLPTGKRADYLVTGVWGEGAVEEAQVLGEVRVAATSLEDGTYRRVPLAEELPSFSDAAYVHYTTNETVHGVQFSYVPDTGSVPLIADVSSDFLSRPMDVSRYGLLYAGAQKNAGPSGVTVVIVRDDLLEQGRKDIPKIFRYSVHAANNSLYNTAPTFSIYMVRNVLLWLKERGGLAVLGEENQRKAQLIYDILDRVPHVYRAPIEKDSRSIMNVVFHLPSEALEKQFLEGAKSRQLVGLKGHRVVGGIRASLYNAVPAESVAALAEYMEEFAQKAL